MSCMRALVSSRTPVLKSTCVVVSCRSLAFDLTLPLLLLLQKVKFRECLLTLL